MNKSPMQIERSKILNQYCIKIVQIDLDLEQIYIRVE